LSRENIVSSEKFKLLRFFLVKLHIERVHLSRL
jgi:hypothetical protein